MSSLYDRIGTGYTTTRRPDPRIVNRIVDLLNLPAGSRILDVGAGSGSYSRALCEHGFAMTALEPSAVMRDQAQSGDEIAWVEGNAEQLPFGESSFDGAIMILCIHHFSDLASAFREIRRVVATGPVVIFTYDPNAVTTPWLFHYFPEFREQIQEAFPSVEKIREFLPVSTSIYLERFPLPPDLVDGFAGAAWRNPERYLEQSFQDGTSAFRQLDPAVREERTSALREDLRSGTWDFHYGSVRSFEEYDHGYLFLTLRFPD